MHTFRCGPGSVTCDPEDGAPVRVSHPEHGEMTFLLDERPAPEGDGNFHDPIARWGKGFAIVDGTAHRWDQPTSLQVSPDSVEASYELGDAELSVLRRFGDVWSERYRWHNRGDTTVSVGSIGISTPFRDVYGDAAASLRSACHAHVWTGGAYSYVWAQRMDGGGPGLGLALTEGELWSYSIGSRNAATSSNVRGHIYLHVTDAARSPHAMGGQPAITLAPGDSVTLGWEIGWYTTFSAFETRYPPPARLSAVSAPASDAVRIELADARLELPAGLAVSASELRADRPGVYDISAIAAGGRSRFAVLFHRPLRVIVERRIDYVLAHQRPRERAGTLAHSFVACDTRWRLRVDDMSWWDWSDGAERIGMARMLQEARRRGWGDASTIDAALDGYARFLRDHLVDSAGTVRSGSRADRRQPRLYNFPWVAAFMLAQYELDGDPADLDDARRIVERYYALEGDRFLAIGIGDCLVGLHRHGVAVADLAVRHADRFIGYGRELPAHEVNYEQSMVAPLLSILIAAHRITGEERFADAIGERLRWMLAFAGTQPHPRLRHIAIRHWDGYWFGIRRQWGDTFPHYWSTLNAAVLLDLPWRDDTLRAMGEAILRGNLIDFAEDGSATCAFVYPSCVNDEPAHVADPLANDQDWALVYAMALGLDSERPLTAR